MCAASSSGAAGEPALDLPTVAAAGVFATALAIAAHGGAQAVLASVMGGEPSLLTSTGLQGDWSWLRNAGYLFVGTGGAAANAMLSAGAWVGFRRGIGRPSTRSLVLWLVFVVNAWVPTVHLIVSPIFDFGDWMMVLDRFPNRGPLRGSVAVTGLFVAGLVWKETVESLARLVGNGASAERVARALRLTRSAWLAGGTAAIVAALLSPLGASSALLLGVGGSFGSTWPILVAARRVGDQPVRGSPLVVRRSMIVLTVGTIAGLMLIAILGRGLPLGGG